MSQEPENQRIVDIAMQVMDRLRGKREAPPLQSSSPKHLHDRAMGDVINEPIAIEGKEFMGFIPGTVPADDEKDA